jgi:hypothetical protein
MPDLDQELLERVARWCAEAGRTTVSAEIRRALEPLGWDELLAVRALLADPPPARPLGPFALADLGRGLPAETAAEREASGHYPAPGAETGAPEAADAEAAAAAAPAPPAPRKGGKRGPKSQGPVIRRARDAVTPPPPPSPSIPLADELLAPEGRTVLERLIRRHGARRHVIVAALAQGWQRPDGRPLDDELLARLLDHHGLARAFASRERDELLHALRASGGLRAAAATRLGLDRDALDAALARSGAAAEAERIREARRAEIRAKATLAERVRLLLADPARLEDLGVLAEVEQDLRRRLPEHVRAVGGAGRALVVALAASLSASAAETHALFERLGIPIDLGPAPAREGAGSFEPRARPRPAFGPPGATGGMRPLRRPVTDRAGPGPRPDRRSPPGASGTFGPPRQRPDRKEGGLGPPRERRARKEGGFGPPRERRDRKEGGLGPPRERRARKEGGFGPPRERRDRKEGGFGPPRERRDRTEGGFGPPRERRDRKEGGFGPPRERRDRKEGGLGPPRERRDRKEDGFGPPRERRPGPKTGTGGAGGARPGRPGPRPGGPRGKPPPRGPRRGGTGGV